MFEIVQQAWMFCRHVLSDTDVVKWSDGHIFDALEG